VNIRLGVPVLVLPLAACSVTSQGDIGRQADAYLTGLETQQGFSGAVLIAQDRQVLFSKGYGWADQERQVPNTPRTRFRVHWVTMPFTALAVMQLQESGKLEVHDSICHHIPECPGYWQGITLHHLLTHTSGVAEQIKPWRSEAGKPTTGLERVALIQHKAPNFQPGAQLRYSENGYIILGAIIEAVSGQPYPDYLRANILEPLGMDNTGYEGSGVVVGYGPPGVQAPPVDLLFRFSASGLYSSVEDLYLWDQALYGDRLLSHEGLERMFTGYARTPSVDFLGADYGYGWFVGSVLGRRAQFHGGGMRGYTSGILRFPEEHVTIIVLRNYGIREYDRLEIELASIVFGEN
jgi:CubicO group peptidase (beta-lactamase class C family)